MRVRIERNGETVYQSIVSNDLIIKPKKKKSRNNESNNDFKFSVTIEREGSTEQKSNANDTSKVNRPTKEVEKVAILEPVKEESTSEKKTISNDSPKVHSSKKITSGSKISKKVEETKSTTAMEDVKFEPDVEKPVEATETEESEKPAEKAISEEEKEEPYEKLILKARSITNNLKPKAASLKETLEATIESNNNTTVINSTSEEDSTDEDATEEDQEEEAVSSNDEDNYISIMSEDKEDAPSADLMPTQRKQIKTSSSKGRLIDSTKLSESASGTMYTEDDEDEKFYGGRVKNRSSSRKQKSFFDEDGNPTRKISSSKSPRK